MTLSNADVRDIDLMLKLAEGGAMGQTSHEMTEALGMTDEGAQSVGVRFSWMRRFGMLDYDDKTGLWALTEGGYRVVEARLRAAAARTIDAIPDESMVDVMAHVTTRYRLGDPMIAHLLRREFVFGTMPRLPGTPSPNGRQR